MIINHSACSGGIIEIAFDFLYGNIYYIPIHCGKSIPYFQQLDFGRPRAGSGPPVVFIAGRPKAALLFWFFGDFRCGALLFMVIRVIYKYKNR